MKFGYLRKDEDGHNYLVPESKISSFDSVYAKMMLEELEWEQKNDEFLEMFYNYRFSGGIEDLKVLME